ncbi:MAG: cytidine deaminase [Candidatus Synechococcus spongiarum SP3]|uniref:tRNA-specific adenosine deaminase n=1 Tax=Candidatus Synechococcus spongiarum SP3 TaxID=1604020 RepID=A0A0G2HLJ2_9SYNE|nr:MAG: cytidine deaminase [Candidatus Synechococcus spongiarum SP3]
MMESSLDHDLATLWMGRLLRRAAMVGKAGEVPVAAVILDDCGRSIGWGANRRERDGDPLGHGELVALRQAAALRGDWRFNDCTLLVTLEPCIMCAAALIQARMGCVVFGAADGKRGGLGGVLDLSKSPAAHHHMVCRGGVLARECGELLRDWFRQRRRDAGAAGGSAAPRSPQSCCDP